jgi:hypothetical protein
VLQLDFWPDRSAKIMKHIFTLFFLALTCHYVHCQDVTPSPSSSPSPSPTVSHDSKYGKLNILLPKSLIARSKEDFNTASKLVIEKDYDALDAMKDEGKIDIFNVPIMVYDEGIVGVFDYIEKVRFKGKSVIFYTLPDCVDGDFDGYMKLHKNEVFDPSKPLDDSGDSSDDNSNEEKEDEKKYFLYPMTDDEATTAFNNFQDHLHRRHVRRVWYDKKTHEYRWIGPETHKLMHYSRDHFDDEVRPWLRPEDMRGD